MRNTALKKILRSAIDVDPFYGVLLRESDSLVLFAREYDFFIDGFQIIRKEDITECSSSNSLRYNFKILKSEGLIGQVLTPDIDLSSWETVFRSLGRKEFVSVEDERTGDMDIGPITKINKKSMVLHYFDGAGKWLDESRIPYSNITTVQFGTNYIRCHRSYIQPQA